MIETDQMTLIPYLIGVLFLLVLGYAILRYRTMHTDTLLSRAVVHILLSVLAVAGYALLASGFSAMLGGSLPPTHPLVIGLAAFTIAILLDPVRAGLQRAIDWLFFRPQRAQPVHDQSFSRQLSQAVELPSILGILRRSVEEGVSPAQLHLFIYDARSNQYAAAPEPDGRPTTDLQFPSTSPLVQTLGQRRQALFLGGSDTLPTALQADRPRLALLDSRLLIPLPAQGQLAGWLAIGPPRSGDQYSSQEIRYLEDLCAQAAVAIERVQVIANLERRVQEMDVLARVAHGVNITLAFDDMLELIYAQTNQIIATVDFRITLTKDSHDALYHAFYLENDERLAGREGQLIPANQGLEREVLRSRQPIRTNDYDYESRTRGLIPAAQGIYAWLGVPLNAGAETIGVISLGSRDPAVVFSQEQQDLLQAIADQTAGAIVKARLLAETETRARQLATLNEIGRGLTSTLEINPLLNRILESAAEILNCEAGSLFMMDEATGELIFEVTVGPVAEDLIGKRLPPGTGIAGQVAERGQAQIVNNVRQQQAWSDQADRSTGFITRDLLAVPMIVKEKIIGVIEVMNKKDGSPFVPADQELLATFTSQAAIAIENARLYTQTDQALSARVEEMSVMQRIDRELNASLDIGRTMQITLEWALRQSKASAGFIGRLDNSGDESRLRLMAVHGFGSGFEQITSRAPDETGERWLPASLPSFEMAVSTGQAQLHVVARPQPEKSSAAAPETSVTTGSLGSFLSDVAEQLVIPIRRQSEAIGLIVLESQLPGTFNQETIAFLTRLCDHAAIAITNAQLYADLQQANLAKSDFVSLVSHELKTPMTSIKGYADLLAQSAVGPINEAQTNFLNTIRSNVNRMATLVSDLADISRIEANRLRLEFGVVKVQDIVEEVIRSAKAQLEEKEHQLALQVPGELPPVWGDQTRLIQILANLVSNANKYTPPAGEIRIHAERTPNRWDPDGAPEVIKISVTDTGYGISEADQAKIFQKFFRSEDQNIRNAPGTGLGLNITRHLVEMQGGKIWFDSTPGEGTTFSFTVPLAQTG